MSTRSMILVQRTDFGLCDLHYRHCDGYPTGVGQEIIDGMRSGMSTGEILAKIGAENLNRTVVRPEDAFLKVQGDLEWLYVIKHPDDQETRSLEILKTTNPMLHGRDFVFSVFWSYQRFLEYKGVPSMELVEYIGNTLFQAFSAFNEAGNNANGDIEASDVRNVAGLLEQIEDKSPQEEESVRRILASLKEEESE